MKYSIRTLREYPHQPITDFAEARNWFIRQLVDDEYVFFTSEHEEIPKMLLDYLDRLEPKYPYYFVRVMELVNGVTRPGSDPGYRANLCSNKSYYTGRIHEKIHPNFQGGYIDIPMLHNSNGDHTYREWEPKYFQSSYFRILRRAVFNVWAIVWDELGHGFGRSRRRGKQY